MIRLALSILATSTAAFASGASMLEDSLFAAESAPLYASDSLQCVKGGFEPPATPAPPPSGPGLSGQVQTSSRSRFLRADLPSSFRRWVELAPLQSFETAGRLDLDAPLPDLSRAHVTMEFDHQAATETSTFSLREAFVDAALADWLRLRAGKQVLQWSRCQLWTPSDLVNVERPQLQQRLGAREGVTGLRAHVPLGARYNLYGFADLHGVRTPSDVALVARVEFTLPRTEVGLNLRHRDGDRMIPALDVSTGYDRWQLAAEAAWLAPGTLVDLRVADGEAWLEPVGERTPQVAVSLWRPFDALGQTDRLRVGAEGFWNPRGVEGNAFVPLTSVKFRQPLAAGRDTVAEGPAAALRVFGGGMRSYQIGQWYVMAYAMLDKAPIASSSLRITGVGNLSDGSWLALCEWSWQSLHGLSTTVSVAAPLGSYPGEFTWTSEQATLRADLGIQF
jgi:hypothetical protein